MCDFHVSRAEILRDFDVSETALQQMFEAADQAFPEMLVLDATGLSIPEASRPLTRMVARCFDGYDQSLAKHSSAV